MTVTTQEISLFGIVMNADRDTTLSAVTKMHVLDVMLGSVREEGHWSVLLLDRFTTRIMSNVCGISDLLDYGVSCTCVAVNQWVHSKDLGSICACSGGECHARK